MNAFAIQLVLVSGDTVGLHALFIGVAVGTGGWQIRRVYTRGGVADLFDGVTAVAIVTGGHILVPPGQTLAVHALLVIAQLIHGKLIGVHLLRVGVTGAT